MPVSPKDFKEAIQSDVWMIDQHGFQHVTDPATGLEMGPESDPNLMCMMTGCVWNSQYATLIKKCPKRGSSNTMALEQFAMSVTLIPTGKDMRCETHSDWLIEQFFLTPLLGQTPVGSWLHWTTARMRGLAAPFGKPRPLKSLTP
jgi:hypothetical protein